MTSMPLSDPVRWPELDHAEGLVLLQLLLHGPTSRVRLAETVGLSRASLTRISRELVDLGLVVEGDVQQRESRGRPSRRRRPGSRCSGR